MQLIYELVNLACQVDKYELAKKLHCPGDDKGIVTGIIQPKVCIVKMTKTQEKKVNVQYLVEANLLCSNLRNKSLKIE